MAEWDEVSKKRGTASFCGGKPFWGVDCRRAEGEETREEMGVKGKKQEDERQVSAPRDGDRKNTCTLVQLTCGGPDATGFQKWAEMGSRNGLPQTPFSGGADAPQARQPGSPRGSSFWRRRHQSKPRPSLEAVSHAGSGSSDLLTTACVSCGIDFGTMARSRKHAIVCWRKAGQRRATPHEAQLSPLCIHAAAHVFLFSSQLYDKRP